MKSTGRSKTFTHIVTLGSVLASLIFLFHFENRSSFAQTPTTEKPLIKQEGKKISIELKNIDIIEVLKLLAQKGNINIVAGKEVRGRVTLFLEDVEIWDALRIIFEANNLAYIWDGGILKVITEREYEQVYGKKFNDIREVRIFKLKNAKVSDVATSINQFKSQLGKVVADERTNSLFVIDVPETLDIIDQSMDTLDVAVTTKVFPLRFATPASIEEAAKNIISKNGILQTDGLSNKVIVTDIQENVDKISQLIQEYDVAPYTITKIFPLKFSRYDEIESKIKDEITPDVGVLRADERTNTIIITDLPSKVARLEKVIHAYDEKTREVLIDAKVVQVTLSDAFSLGIDWEVVLETFRGRNVNFSLVNATSEILGAPAAPLNSIISSGVGFPTSTSTATTGTTATSTSTTSTTTTATSTGTTSSSSSFFPQPGTIPFDLTTTRSPFTFPRVSQGGTVVATGTLFGSDAFSAALNALKQVGKVNLLSSPRITAISGEEAKIAVATREAFVTNTVVQNDTVATTAENVTFIDVGVILSVTPTINPDYYVNMKIRPEVSAVVRTLTTAEGNVIPIVSTQEAESTVLIRDGVTVILGGLISDSRVRRDSRIPVFGSLPIVGPLFRNTSYNLVKDEIVIFLTPHILSGDTAYEGSWVPSQGVEKYIEEEIRSRAKESDVVTPDSSNKSSFREDTGESDLKMDLKAILPEPNITPLLKPTPLPSISEKKKKSEELFKSLSQEKEQEKTPVLSKETDTEKAEKIVSLLPQPELSTPSMFEENLIKAPVVPVEDENKLVSFYAF